MEHRRNPREMIEVTDRVRGHLSAIHERYTANGTPNLPLHFCIASSRNGGAPVRRTSVGFAAAMNPMQAGARPAKLGVPVTMAASVGQEYPIAIHPVHAVLLAAMFPLFLGGLLSDLAYSSSYEIQWSNFAAWLIAGAMLVTGFTLFWALIDLIRSRRGGRPLIYFLALVSVFALGLINSFVHARDAWAVMPQGLLLSAIVTVLALIAIWLGFAGWRGGPAR